MDRKFAGEIFSSCTAIVFGFHRAAFILFDAATLEHPGCAVAGEALFDIDGD